MTIYGSSHIRNVNYIGVTGPTGNTGATGNFGLGGAIGRTGPTGNTGANISGMTLNSSGNIVTIFDNNTTAIGPAIDAPDGAYYLFADGQNIAGDGYSAFYGLTYEGQGTVPVLKFRGITTGSFNQELQIVGISSSSQSEDITVRYSITNLSYIGICGGTQGQLIIQKVGNYFYGLTGTFYDKANQTVDLQVQNYGERVKFVRPTIKDFIDSEGGESAGTYIYWPIDYTEGNIFVLNSYWDEVENGEEVFAQIVLVKEPPRSDTAKGITIIVPPGITSSETVFTGYATTDDLTGGITLSADPNIDSYNISWPLTYPPCLTTGLDVINMISFDGLWYANYGIYDSNTSQVDWDIIYNNCAGSVDLPDPDVTGLCCKVCDTAGSFVSTDSACAKMGNEYVFFPGESLTSGCKLCSGPDGASMGVCCVIRNTETGQVYEKTTVNACQCSRSATLSYESATVIYPFKWTPLSDVVSEGCIDCENLFNDVGACCDGGVGCTQLTKAQCDNSYGIFSQAGLKCKCPDDNPTQLICDKTNPNGTTGGCCYQGNCTNVANGTLCQGTWYGSGTLCNEAPDWLAAACVPSGGGGGGEVFVPNFTDNGGPYPIIKSDGTITNLFAGDYFAGGIVVGVFNPNGATCWGNTAHGGLGTETEDNSSSSQFNRLNSGSEKICRQYQSVAMGQGYGFTTDAIINNERSYKDAWILIVSNRPVGFQQKSPANNQNNSFEVIPTTAGGFNSTPNQSSTLANPTWGSVVSADLSINYQYNYVTRFIWGHGGTSSSNAFDDNFDGTFDTKFNPGADSCYAILPDAFIACDGFYGATLSGQIQYIGNSTSFNLCSEDGDQCINCNLDPLSKIKKGVQSNLYTQNGWYTRNWGIRNTCMMGAAECANYYLVSGNGLGGSNYSGYKQYYGSSGDFVSGFTGATHSTAMEGISVWNRTYWNDYDPILDDYPQLSRWYVPSIDELAYIAYNCINPTRSLQSKFGLYNGEKIGSGAVGPNADWVWSSTKTFDETIVRQYNATSLDTNSDGIAEGEQAVQAIDTPALTTNRFTKAWAMKFDQGPAGFEVNTGLDKYKIKKADCYRNEYELRPVRMIRCDQKYYNNESPEDLRNNVWFVPKLTPAAIITGQYQRGVTYSSTTNTTEPGELLSVYRNPQ